MIFNIEKTGIGIGTMSNGTTANPLLEVQYPAHFYKSVTFNGLNYMINPYAASTLYNGATGSPTFRKLGNHVYLEGELTVTAQNLTNGFPVLYIPAPCRPEDNVYWVAPTSTVGHIAYMYLNANDGSLYCLGIYAMNSADKKSSGEYSIGLTKNYIVPNTNAGLNTETAKTSEIYVVYNNGIAGGVSWKPNAYTITSPYYGYSNGSGKGTSSVNETTLSFTVASGSSSYKNGANISSYATVAIPSDAKNMVVTIKSATYNGKTITFVAGLLPKNASNPYSEMLTSATKTYTASSETDTTLSVDVSSYAGSSQLIILHMYSDLPTSDNSQLSISKIEFTTT